jgi:hypothetical protein
VLDRLGQLVVELEFQLLDFFLKFLSYCFHKLIT